MNYYLAAEIKSIQEYIFKTDKLKEIVGASALIDKFAHYCDKKEGFEVIQKNAGSFKVVVADKTKLVDFLKTFEKDVQKEYPNVDLVYAFTDFEGSFTNEVRQVVENKLKEKRNQISKPFNSLPSIVKRSPRTGMGLINRDQDYEISKKEEARKKDDRFEEIFGKERFVSEFEDLKNSKSLIAVIHADGNNLRKLIPKMLNNSSTYKEDLKEFSLKLDSATKKATKRAYDESFYDNEKFRPIILAGDDLTVICSADYALDFTHLFLKYFEEETKKELGKFLGKAGVDSLTACAGIAYTKYNFPIHYGLDLAEELCKYTKDTLKAKEENIPSALSFHFVQSSYFEDFETTQKRELQIQDLSLLFAPYYLERTPLINDLKELVEKFEQKNKIKTTFREWLNIYADSKENGTHFLERRYEILKDEFEDLKIFFDDIGISFNEPFINNKTPIADIVKLSSLQGEKK